MFCRQGKPISSDVCPPCISFYLNLTCIFPSSHFSITSTRSNSSCDVTAATVFCSMCCQKSRLILSLKAQCCLFSLFLPTMKWYILILIMPFLNLKTSRCVAIMFFFVNVSLWKMHPGSKHCSRSTAWSTSDAAGVGAANRTQGWNETVTLKAA